MKLRKISKDWKTDLFNKTDYNWTDEEFKVWKKEFKKAIEILKNKNLTRNLIKGYNEFKEGKGYSEKEVFGHLD